MMSCHSSSLYFDVLSILLRNTLLCYVEDCMFYPIELLLQVSKPGSVKVEKLMNVERYSHVMHISSTVRISILSWNCTSYLQNFPSIVLSGSEKITAF